MTALELTAVVLAVVCVPLAVLVVRLRRTLADARTETEQLRGLVKNRLERPNVFFHEVRTPLTLIQGAAELLADEAPGPLTARQREFVGTISANAERVSGLAEDMLTEARLDSPLFNLRVERVDLRQVTFSTNDRRGPDRSCSTGPARPAQG